MLLRLWLVLADASVVADNPYITGNSEIHQSPLLLLYTEDRKETAQKIT
jgi:hypothetical protein